MSKSKKRERPEPRRVRHIGEGWLELEKETSLEDPCKHIWQSDGNCYWCGVPKRWL